MDYNTKSIICLDYNLLKKYNIPLEESSMFKLFQEFLHTSELDKTFVLLDNGYGENKDLCNQLLPSDSASNYDNSIRKNVFALEYSNGGGGGVSSGSSNKFRKKYTNKIDITDLEFDYKYYNLKEYKNDGNKVLSYDIKSEYYMSPLILLITHSKSHICNFLSSDFTIIIEKKHLIAKDKNNSFWFRIISILNEYLCKIHCENNVIEAALEDYYKHIKQDKSCCDDETFEDIEKYFTHGKEDEIMQKYVVETKLNNNNNNNNNNSNNSMINGSEYSCYTTTKSHSDNTKMDILVIDKEDDVKKVTDKKYDIEQHNLLRQQSQQQRNFVIEGENNDNKYYGNDCESVINLISLNDFVRKRKKTNMNNTSFGVNYDENNEKEEEEEEEDTRTIIINNFEDIELEEKTNFKKRRSNLSELLSFK